MYNEFIKFICKGGFNMAKCNWCGAEVSDGTKVCLKCKAEISNNNPVINTNNSELSTNKESTTNATSVILKVIGWIAIVSGIIGIFLNNAYSVVAIISGIFVIGFGEIIKLLQSINDKLK